LSNAVADTFDSFANGAWALSIIQERELVIAMVSGSTAPVKIRKITQLTSMYEWQREPSRQYSPPLWKLYPRRMDFRRAHDN
jgi:hypothetical protein